MVATTQSLRLKLKEHVSALSEMEEQIPSTTHPYRQSFRLIAEMHKRTLDLFVDVLEILDELENKEQS